MINSKSYKEVNKNVFKNFRTPNHAYSFAKIQRSILNILKNNPPELPEDVLPKNLDFENIVMILIDGFGWNSFERMKNESSFLIEIEDKGIISKLTSQFPATTAAEVTTMHTGDTVEKHGILEWFYYEPKIGEVIAPLLFSFAGDDSRETLKSLRVDPLSIFPRETFYQKLRKEKLKSYIVCPDEFMATSYSSALFKGADVIKVNSFKNGLDSILSILEKDKNKKYINFYYEKLDSIGHAFGPESAEFKEEISSILQMLKIFCLRMSSHKKTLIIITSDHGQKQIDPDKTQYVNVLAPEIIKMLKKTKSGKPIAPAGEPRDMFLYVKDDRLDKAEKILKEKLKDCLVVRAEDLIKEKVFSEKISQDFKAKLGNLVLLPTSNNAVWWYEKGKFEVERLGYHGGMSKEEMEIPFIIPSLD